MGDMDDFQDKMPKDMNIYFHKWGIAHEASVVENDKKGTQIYKTLKETIKELGHDDLPAIDIFKIDCEGCEFTTHTDWVTSDNTIPRFQQILVEVHNPKGGNANNFFDSFKNAGYVTFSKEHNIQMPGLSMSEYSFLKLDPEFFQVP